MKKANSYGFAAFASICCGVTLASPASAENGANLIFDTQGASGWTAALFSGQHLVAPSCYYHLEMQGDGNLVTYGGSEALGASNTPGHPGAFAILQTDGNFVESEIIPGGAGVDVLWSSGTEGYPFDTLQIQDDGNVVIYADSVAKWATNTEKGYASAPCTETSSVTYMFSNKYVYSGTVIGATCDDGVGEAGPASCGTQCATTSGCGSWTYYPDPAASYPSGPGSCAKTGACYLFEGQFNAEIVGTFEGAISGVLGDPATLF